MSFSDHYATLGLDRCCTLAQIRSAYRLLARRHHPDLNPGSAEALARSQEINAAHETLSDPALRRAYDRELAAAERPAPLAARTKIERNLTQEMRVRVTDFIHGADLTVRVNDPANPEGPEVYEVHVPAGTAPGTRLRVPRAGAFEGGFVLVKLRVLPHFRFKARGSDLLCDLRIRAERAASGGRETISSATGSPLTVTIPRGVARGEMIRLRGEGLPKPRGGRGDLLVKITYRPEVRISRR